ncbi:YjcZ family sporulation protein [Lentibacillus juripiscarius]|uniref:YjcZ family sporulation protein n=1 Tax=Lentibacillus juripiscarius TaxID=257446 RepID=A0ABW5VAN4_9BACI
MGWFNPCGCGGYGSGYGAGYGAGYGYGSGYGCGAGTGGFGQNGFVLLVVLFILLIIVGSNYPMGGDNC